MCLGGSPHIDTTVQDAQLAESKQARADEEARQARIKQGTTDINNQFSQFGDDFYNKRSSAYTDWYQPQLDDKFSQARNDLTYAFARAGTLNSTAAADKNALLQKQYDTQRSQIQASAQGEADNLRSGVEQQKTALVSQLNATGDADQASNQALAQTKQLYNQVPAYNSLGDIFSGVAAGIGGLYNSYNNQQIYNAANPAGAYADRSTTIK